PLIAPPTTDAPTIPPSPDYTPASPDYSPASEAESDPYEDPSSSHIPPLPATSPFLSSDDNTTDSDTPDTPLSPTHDTPFTKITASTQRSPVIPRRRRVRSSPVQQLSVRHPVDHSSSDSSSRHSSSDHSSPDLLSTSAGPSRKRRRSPMTSVPALPLVSGALSPVYADLIPPPKRVKDIGYLADVEDDPRETRDERVTHPAMPEDIPEPAQEGVVEVTYETLGDLVQRIVGVELAVTALTERVAELERDNQRLRGTASVESQRVDRLQRGMSRMQREMRLMRRFRFYDRTRDERVTHPVMPEDIPEPAQEGAAEVTYATLGDLVQRFHDHTQAIPVHRIQTIEGIQREQGRRIVGVESTVIALTERVAEL
nr:hypothetical protein [Tanacetum cinerariifolium]